jgi:uncharacterized protein (TIGR02594 family)
MTNLPARYSWLAAEPGPRMILEALKLYGTLEGPGDANNAKILAWADEVGQSFDSNYARWVADFYNKDSIPWCGLFMAVVAMRGNPDKRPERNPPANFLAALSWAAFGVPTPTPGLGDVLVFVRQGGGHVALYVGEDDTAYHVIGGNQSDQVNVTRIAKSRRYAIRRPAYNVQPANVRPIRLAAQGGLSTNEG